MIEFGTSMITFMLSVAFSIVYTIVHMISKYIFVRNRAFGCVSLEKSESGFLIQDHSDHGVSKEPTNPLWVRIPRFL